MKRIVNSSEYIFAMSKVVDKYAIPSVAANIGKYIYFSESNSSHGPRIKFYGGTKETASTTDAPTLAFDVEGNCRVELADWMNKKNCPNAFDKLYISKLHKFIAENKSILLLVWFGHLDEADALAYFHGAIDFDELIDDIAIQLSDDIETLEDLDKHCLDNGIYRFNIE